MYTSSESLQKDLTAAQNDHSLLRNTVIDELIYTAVFSEEENLKREAKQAITTLVQIMGIQNSSLQPIYTAVGKGEMKGFTVPAINVKTLTYDTARAFFRSAQKHNIGLFIFEIAPTEMEYTHQRPDEFATCVFAAAIKENYKGPVFLQGDHFQLSLKRFTADAQLEKQRITNLIDEAIQAHFYNIDIDASTLVDLSQQSLSDQQKTNYELTAFFTTYIREKQPKDIAISIGGEIGHIGGKNSTREDFEAFMKGYLANIQQAGISKVSVQTGTSHGGTPLPDGSVQEVAVDFSVLETIGKVARETYSIGGPVQHGASTLPLDLFHKFPSSHTLEIHLATGFQNTMYETLPDSLRSEIYTWLKENQKADWETGWTEEQFIYKTRKKAAGPFKEKLWNLPDSEKRPIIDTLQIKFEKICEKLKVYNTLELTAKYSL